MAYLRELARKHLGPGHSKLKTKAELVAALVTAVPAVAKVAGLVAGGRSAAKTAAKVAAKTATTKPAQKAAKTAAPKPAPKTATTKSAQKTDAKPAAPRAAAKTATPAPAAKEVVKGPPAAPAEAAARKTAASGRAAEDAPEKPAAKKAPARKAVAAEAPAPRPAPEAVPMDAPAVEVPAAESQAARTAPGPKAAARTPAAAEDTAASKPAQKKAPARKTAAKRAAPAAAPSATEEAAAAGAPPEPFRDGPVPAPATTARAEVVSFPARPRSRPEPAAQQASSVGPPAAEGPVATSIPEEATPPSAESAAPASPAPIRPPSAHEPALHGETEELSAMEQHEAEPLVEGFFVARVAGEEEARRHHLTHPPAHEVSAPHPSSQGMGELPSEYADDAAIALPRDPRTLFVFWDISQAARERALNGVSEPRAVLRVFEGERMVREQDFALESRSFYLHGLTPGRAYRVELHFVGRDGRSRRIGHSTNRVQLPPEGPSADHSVRFMRVPAAGVPRLGALEPQPAALPPAATVREYITWRRVPLPGSGGFEDLVEVRRESELPPPGPAAEQPSSPTYLEAPPRSEGSSDQTSWSPSPSGRGR
ncbi:MULTISPECIES: DUF4912 domain-containing protein [Myxococcaceae]|uniref:DUF4912 domain-containing protein n=1 Tax=Myxococcaceae TaxID=31 RepID=UPI00188E1516|nr:DUF4912 domain-containing protein [Simulacricoccus sp. 17bor-14]